MNYLIIRMAIISILFLCSCKVDREASIKTNDTDTTKIQLHFSDDLVINNSKFIEFVDNYINEIEKEKRDDDFVYQLIIGRYANGYNDVVLTLFEKEYENRFPVGYFKYKGRLFLISSALNYFCGKDTSFFMENGININVDDNKWHYRDYPTKVLKISKDSIFQEYTTPPEVVKKNINFE